MSEEKRFQGVHQGNGPEVTTPKPEAPTKALVNVDAQTSGVLIGRNMDEEYRIAKALCVSKILPGSYDTPEKVFAARQLAFELGLKPMTGMRQIAVINGTPSIFGDLPLAIVRQSGQLESFKEFFIDEKGQEISFANGNLKSVAWGAVCVSKRKGMATSDTRTFTLDDARNAKLYPSTNPDKPWAKHTKRMLQMRARSWNLKDVFSDFLNGVAIAEYDLNQLPEETAERVKDVTPTSELNAMFGVDTPKAPEPVEVLEPVLVPEVVTEADLAAAAKAKADEMRASDDPVEHVFAPRMEELGKPTVFADLGVMAVGLFAGSAMADVPKEKLADYYRKLRVKKTSLDVEHLNLLAKIEAYLG